MKSAGLWSTMLAYDLPKMAYDLPKHSALQNGAFLVGHKLEGGKLMI